MKKLFYIAMSLLLAVTFTACNDDGEVGEVDLGYLELVSSDVKFDYRGGSGDIVAMSATPLTAKAADEWVSVAVKGNVVTVTVPVISELETRNSSVTVSDGRRSVVVPVSQTSFTLFLSGQALSFARESGSQDISFDPQAVAVNALPSEEWVKATVNNGVITVTAEENRGNTRTATITFTSGEQEAAVTVTQASALSVTSKTVEAGGMAGNYEVAFDALADAVVTAESDAAWAVPTVADGKVSVATENCYEGEIRRATVTLTTDGGATETFTVAQPSLPLTYDVWANGVFTSQYDESERAATISQARENNKIFRIDSPFVEGYHYVFRWDIDKQSVELFPVGIPYIDEEIGIDAKIQETGMMNGDYPIVWMTDRVDIYYPIFGFYFTWYDPETKTLTFNSVFDRWNGVETLDGGYYLDDTFRITEFLKGDPWAE